MGYCAFDAFWFVCLEVSRCSQCILCHQTYSSLRSTCPSWFGQRDCGTSCIVAESTSSAAQPAADWFAFAAIYSPARKLGVRIGKLESTLCSTTLVSKIVAVWEELEDVKGIIYLERIQDRVLFTGFHRYNPEIRTCRTRLYRTIPLQSLRAQPLA